MPAVTLTPEDLAAFGIEIAEEKAEAMIEDALGMAKLLAPCIFEFEFEHAAAAKGVLRNAILRWNESGTGAAQSLTALGFSQTFDTRQTRRAMFQPAEIEQLQQMCPGRGGGAYGIDTAPYDVPQHADICALNLGANYCSCGASLTLAGPLWETP